MACLVTIETDGYRDFVTFPDGRQLNMGSISILTLVTTLTKSKVWRKTLDTFNKDRKALISVDLQALTELLSPRRSRWACHGDPFIPSVSHQPSRGYCMTPTELHSQLTTIEQHLASMQGDQTPGKVATLVSLVTTLESKVASSTGSVSTVLAKVATLEGVLQKIGSAKTASSESIEALLQASNELCASVTGKEAAVDDDAKRELRLFMADDPSLSNKKEDIILSIRRKMQGDKYSSSQAPQIWLHLVNDGAKRYAQQFGGDELELFPMNLRKALAHDFAVKEERAIKAGDYDHIRLANDSQQEQEEGQQKTAATLDSQLKKLKAKPPILEGTTIKLFSPVLNKYFAMVEYDEEANAEAALSAWNLGQQKIQKTLVKVEKKSDQEGKTASKGQQAQEQEEGQQKTAALSLDNQLKKLKSKPPIQEGTTIKLFSPVLNKYLAMVEYDEESNAEAALGAWDLGQKKIQKTLVKVEKDSDRESKTASETHTELANQLMATIKVAQSTVAGSLRSGNALAKRDLYTISSKLNRVLTGSSLGDPSVRQTIEDLALKANHIQKHFSSKGV